MSATLDHPTFGTPAQRASNARLHTTLPCSLPLLPARASLAAALTACGSVHAPLGRRSALNVNSTRRACTLLLDYKLAQRYGLALATPVRRRVTLAARSAARRRAMRR